MKKKLREKRKQNVFLTIQTITAVVIGVATIWSFINSKQIQDKLLALEELKFTSNIKIKFEVDTVINCENRNEEMLTFSLRNNGFQ